MTLRLRLLLLLVVIVASGLLVSDVVTYTSLRSFLITRIDQQLPLATFPVERALSPPGAVTGASATAESSTPATSASPTGTTPTPITPPASRDNRDPRGTSPGLSPRGIDRGVLIPPGTFGELRDAAGKVQFHVFFSYGGKSPIAPVLPASLPGSGTRSTSDLFFTATSAGSDGIGYRVLARPRPNGAGTIVVAQPLTDLDSTLRHLLLIEIIVSLLLLAVLGVFSSLMVRRDMRPLEEMAETASVIAGGDLSQRVTHITPGTEVGELGLAFNRMIAEIEGAFAARAASEDRLRRFLADASHELRTPLTSILGYAEIFDLGVRDRPAELATSMRYIKNEAARMGTLVDDLFVLAQLDGERSLTREPVDLTELVRHSVASFAITAPDRPVMVDVSGPEMVMGDPNRMRQVVDNLVGNAIAHTPAGTAIDVTVRHEDTEAVLRVHDDGSGIDSADLSRIFEPFFRSDPSRARATGGGGLGLAIVASIVAAHGGTVAVVPGGGATFEVRILTGRSDATGRSESSEDTTADAATAEAGGEPVGNDAVSQQAPVDLPLNR
jgi:two-component system, OmpR family, sensor kinase